jgi:phosphoadenosine phosphosulfate reductase
LEEKKPVNALDLPANSAPPSPAPSATPGSVPAAQVTLSPPAATDPKSNAQPGPADSTSHPDPDLWAELQAASSRLESAQPWEILAWTAQRFGAGFAVATAFGAEGMLIIHWLAKYAPQTPIFNLETGYQFPETLAMVDRVRHRYGLDIELVRPELSVPQYEQLHGGPVHSHSPDQCCRDRKLVPLRRRLEGVTAWASAIRRDQSPDRSVVPIVGWDRKFGLVKVSPLANWTKRQVWQTIVAENVPYNPLHDQGYPSIGCQPCTRCILAGEDERAGRWAGSKKTECGLHSQD